MEIHLMTNNMRRPAIIEDRLEEDRLEEDCFEAAGPYIPSPMNEHAAPRRKVRVEWHRTWSPSVSEAFAALPYDPLMDPELVRRLWEDGVGRDRQKIAVLRGEDTQVAGVVPLRKRGKLSWQLLTQYVLPYARFFVLPAYTDAALKALGREIDCNNVSFYRMPAHTRMLRPEESWVTALESSYDELMRRTKYRKEDRQCRRYAEGLELAEDRYELLPAALAHWQAKWLKEGSRVAASRKDDLLLSFQILAEQGRLKTFSLHDGDKFAAMEMNMIGPVTMYSMTTIMLDEYRKTHAGIRLTLAAMQWGCANGMAEYDMLRTSGHYKKRWAEPVTNLCRQYDEFARFGQNDHLRTDAGSPRGPSTLGRAGRRRADISRRRTARTVRYPCCADQYRLRMGRRVSSGCQHGALRPAVPAFTRPGHPGH